jgi:hypothetical protein
MIGLCSNCKRETSNPKERYESETGQKATYRKDSSDYHTLRYVRWLEAELAKAETYVTTGIDGLPPSRRGCEACWEKWSNREAEE